MDSLAQHSIVICSKCCGSEASDSLAKTLSKRVPAGFTVRTVSCMAGCKRPMTLAFQAKRKAQYLFGDINAEEQTIAALVEFARQYQQSQDGWFGSRSRPKELAGKVLSRLPPL